MSTRTRGPRTPEEPSSEQERPEAADLFSYEASYGLDDEITDDDIENFLREKEAEEEKPGFWNLPTIAGLSTIGVGSAYLLQELGFSPLAIDFSALVGPWLIGVLIILIGFGVLSWSPDRQKRRQKQRERAAQRRARRQTRSASSGSERRRERKDERRATRRERYERRKGRFAKSRTNRKIAGVCGGIGEALGIDPTLVRIAFVIALIAGSGMAIPVYLLLAWLMPTAERPDLSPNPGPPLDDERVIMIR